MADMIWGLTALAVIAILGLGLFAAADRPRP